MAQVAQIAQIAQIAQMVVSASAASAAAAPLPPPSAPPPHAPPRAPQPTSPATAAPAEALPLFAASLHESLARASAVPRGGATCEAVAHRHHHYQPHQQQGEGGAQTWTDAFGRVHAIPPGTTPAPPTPPTPSRLPKPPTGTARHPPAAAAAAPPPNHASTPRDAALSPRDGMARRIADRRMGKRAAEGGAQSGEATQPPRLYCPALSPTAGHAAPTRASESRRESSPRRGGRESGAARSARGGATTTAVSGRAPRIDPGRLEKSHATATAAVVGGRVGNGADAAEPDWRREAIAFLESQPPTPTQRAKLLEAGPAEDEFPAFYGRQQ